MQKQGNNDTIMKIYFAPMEGITDGILRRAHHELFGGVDVYGLIIAERMALTLRADFPHDAYWTHGHLVDSNGDEIAFDLQKTGERQWIDLGGRRISWLRLEKMIKSDDPSSFLSLRAWEVIGSEMPQEKQEEAGNCLRFLFFG